MNKGDINQLTKELTDIQNLKIETENISYIPNEQASPISIERYGKFYKMKDIRWKI